MSGEVVNLRRSKVWGEETRWGKGKSGNPSGNSSHVMRLRSKVRKAAATHSMAALNRLVELLASSDERVAYMAAVAILDRAGVRATDTPSKDNEGISLGYVIVPAKAALGTDPPTNTLPGGNGG